MADRHDERVNGRPVARSVEIITFRVDDTAAVLAQMDRLSAAHRGWINIEPRVEEENEPPPPTGLGAIFSTGVYDIPICTWVAGKTGRHGTEPDSVGVQHATGTRVVARLAERGVPVPDGWRWVQDHPRRGLVADPQPGGQFSSAAARRAFSSHHASSSS